MRVSGQRHAPAALYPRGKDPRYPLDRRLGGPRAGLDAEARRKILCPCRGSNPERPARSQTQHWLSYCGSIFSVDPTIYGMLKCLNILISLRVGLNLLVHRTRNCRYTRCRISTVLYQYREEHQYPIRGKILKPVSCVEPFPGLSGTVMQMISLSSKNSGYSLTSKCWLLYVCRFMFFSIARSRRTVAFETSCTSRSSF
jgi:hypothetical protein